MEQKKFFEGLFSCEVPMMKKGGRCLAGSMFLVILSALCLQGCARIVSYEKEEFTISKPHVIFFGNLTEVIIDPGNETCRIVYEHYNRKRGDAFHVPYGVATVSFAGRKYVVSDRRVGNFAIRIDGREFSLKDSNPLIRAGQGVLWTREPFKQDLAHKEFWVYPLKRDISEVITR